MACTGDVYLHMGAPPGKCSRFDILPFTDVKTTSVERDDKRGSHRDKVREDVLVQNENGIYLKRNNKDIDHMMKER
jgi:hypothetical protein